MLCRALLTRMKQRSLSAAVPSPDVTALNPSTEEVEAAGAVSRDAVRTKAFVRVAPMHGSTQHTDISGARHCVTSCRPATTRGWLLGVWRTFSAQIRLYQRPEHAWYSVTSVPPRTELAIVGHRTGILGGRFNTIIRRLHAGSLHHSHKWHSQTSESRVAEATRDASCHWKILFQVNSSVGPLSITCGLKIIAAG